MPLRPRSTAALLPLLAALLAGCGGGGPSRPIAPLVLEPGARYFSIAGEQRFLATRNVTGRSVAEICALLDKARDEGTKLVRIHVTHGGDPAWGMGITNQGAVVEDWAARWDQIFDRAEADGLYVLPVFGVWADFNDGSNGEAWHTWHLNPLSPAMGGRGASPEDLFVAGSALQADWLGWLGQVVSRWQAHQNVAGWEVFSELDLVTHGTDSSTFEDRGVAFVEAAAAVIRAADPEGRPVTASLAWWLAWPELYASDGIDLAQIHLYGPDQVLDEAILSVVPQVAAHGKPVLLGESGLDWRAPDGTTQTTAARGPTGTRHAVWAALVAGAMNGRALWWEDAYDLLQNGASAAPFVTGYPGVEAPAVRLLSGRELAGLSPALVAFDEALTGGAIGDDATVIGWVRAGGCEPPAWSCATELGGRNAYVYTSGFAARWQVAFYDAATGAPYAETAMLTRDGLGTVVVPLRTFADDLVFVLTAQQD